ncbi:MAG: LacI family DNA-binding transcriptional regulator [Capsulimonadaceae bacterium]|nr:LacI family DNA-binding transcriptional regulator [Capsulimonadaceae bacterium]
MELRKYRKSTINDVATAAGVSVSTVSAYVRGRRTVCSMQTADRITRAIAELHYSPSAAARGSSDRSTNTIGVVTWDVLPYNTLADDLYYFRLNHGIQSVLNERDVMLLTYPSSIRKSTGYSAIIDGRVDGVLMGASITDDRPEKIARAGLPIVVLERYRALPDGCGAACASEADVVRLALEHLWGLGHRRIAHLSGGVDDDPHGDCQASHLHDFAIWRRRHYIDWMRQRGAYDPRLERTGGGWSISVERALAVLDAWLSLPEPPTAVFCANDRIAIGLMQAATSRRLRIPEDLSVVGVDNQPRAAAAGLTTVDVPLEAIGRAGAEALLDMMAGLPFAECRRMVGVSDLVVRQSTAPPQ